MGMTFVEKILARNAGQTSARAGEILVVQPDHLLTHDNTAAILEKIKDDLTEHGICRTSLPVIVLDHVVPAASEKTATNHQRIRAFVKDHAVEHFYDVGHGICHQVVVEKGIARPGQVIVGSDSHTCSYGAVGAFSTGVDRTEAAALLLRGLTWLKVPETIKITLTGRLKPPVAAKDLILTIIGRLGAGGAAYRAVEFHGDGVAHLGMGERFTLSNMGVEMGAKCAAFPVDDVTIAHLERVGAAADAANAVWADDDAEYEREETFDLDALEPVVAKPHTVDNLAPVSEVAGTEIHQALVGTCTNGRLEDLEVAADVLEGKRVADGVRMLVLPASKDVFEAAIESGAVARLSRAGAMVLPPGCGPCLGAHQGVLAPGERCISTANRNFRGRMGCKEAEIFLASPATVAASAAAGRIVDPRG
jgi:3-isopropylmalate/(R)-2-methylmalate dehydratase large subunit